MEFDTTKNWISDFPTDHWCLIIIADEKHTYYFDEIIRKSIDRNVGYICGVGKQADLIHDMADEEIEFRDVDIDDYYLPNHVIMTVGEEDFENGIWFGLNLTFNYETDIDEIIIIDMTKKAFGKITELIEKLENGYLPTE
ncbi:hypothetical protein [Robertkochia solimangrovi]|uniref:hypothetical protein n=1 Tax=Robertkochia solimangrovi TaxID=2213046 RepID=UPI00117E7036|nr:hypothetical protein [Robertkochia solimangrovi]